MQSFCESIRLVKRHASNGSKIVNFNSRKGRPMTDGSISSRLYSLDRIHRNEVGDVNFVGILIDFSNGLLYRSLRKFTSQSSLALRKPSITAGLLTSSNNGGIHSVSFLLGGYKSSLFHQSMAMQTLPCRCITTMNDSGDSVAQDATDSVSNVTPRIKFKRLDKTAKHIMQILDKEAVEEVRNQREIPDIKPGHIIQLKVEVPDNKRRVSILKGIVIARRNAGLNTTFRLRRLVAGVGIESLFPLYSPNIKEIKVLDRKKVRRAKLYYLRDRMNPLKK